MQQRVYKCKELSQNELDTLMKFCRENIHLFLPLQKEIQAMAARKLAEDNFPPPPPDLLVVGKDSDLTHQSTIDVAD